MLARTLALAFALLPLASGCIDYAPYGIEDDPPVAVDVPDEVVEDEQPVPFEVFAYDLPTGTSVADGWTFDRTQRHVGGMVSDALGLRSATLSLTTPTGGILDSLEFSGAWEGVLTASPKRVWLDDQGLDWVAWRGEDAEWLGLRGLSELTVLDTVGAQGMDAWVGEDELILVACGEDGLRVLTTGFDGSVRTDDQLDISGDQCMVLSPHGKPMILHGSSSGGPLVRWRLVDGLLVDLLQINADLPADQVATASEDGMALFALADGQQVALITAWGDTRHVAPATTAEWLVVDVLSDGTTAVAWVDGQGMIHAHWGGLSALPAVVFEVDAPPLGLAVGLRDEVVSIATFDGEAVILGRQLP